MTQDAMNAGGEHDLANELFGGARYLRDTLAILTPGYQLDPKLPVNPRNQQLREFTEPSSPIWKQPPYPHEVVLYQAGLVISSKVEQGTVGQTDVAGYVRLLKYIIGLTENQVLAGKSPKRIIDPMLLSSGNRQVIETQIEKLKDPNFVGSHIWQRTFQVMARRWGTELARYNILDEAKLGELMRASDSRSVGEAIS